MKVLQVQMEEKLDLEREAHSDSGERVGEVILGSSRKTHRRR